MQKHSNKIKDMRAARSLSALAAVLVVLLADNCLSCPDGDILAPTLYSTVDVDQGYGEQMVGLLEITLTNIKEQTDPLTVSSTTSSSLVHCAKISKQGKIPMAQPRLYFYHEGTCFQMFDGACGCNNGCLACNVLEGEQIPDKMCLNSAFLEDSAESLAVADAAAKAANCPRGQFYSFFLTEARDVAVECAECPKGSYQSANIHKYRSCTMCPSGKTTLETGSQAESDCKSQTDNAAIIDIVPANNEDACSKLSEDEKNALTLKFEYAQQSACGGEQHCMPKVGDLVVPGIGSPTTGILQFVRFDVSESAANAKLARVVATSATTCGDVTVVAYTCDAFNNPLISAETRKGLPLETFDTSKHSSPFCYTSDYNVFNDKLPKLDDDAGKDHYQKVVNVDKVSLTTFYKAENGPDMEYKVTSLAQYKNERPLLNDLIVAAPPGAQIFCSRPSMEDPEYNSHDKNGQFIAEDTRENHAHKVIQFKQIGQGEQQLIGMYLRTEPLSDEELKEYEYAQEDGLATNERLRCIAAFVGANNVYNVAPHRFRVTVNIQAQCTDTEYQETAYGMSDLYFTNPITTEDSPNYRLYLQQAFTQHLTHNMLVGVTATTFGLQSEQECQNMVNGHVGYRYIPYNDPNSPDNDPNADASNTEKSICELYAEKCDRRDLDVREDTLTICQKKNYVFSQCCTEGFKQQFVLLDERDTTETNVDRAVCAQQCTKNPKCTAYTPNDPSNPDKDNCGTYTSLKFTSIPTSVEKFIDWQQDLVSSMTAEERKRVESGSACIRTQQNTKSAKDSDDSDDDQTMVIVGAVAASVALAGIAIVAYIKCAGGGAGTNARYTHVPQNLKIGVL